MSHRSLLKSLLLNAIVISVFILLVVLAFGGSLTIQAQTGGPGTRNLRRLEVQPNRPAHPRLNQCPNQAAAWACPQNPGR
jgi:hypothetical protein